MLTPHDVIGKSSLLDLKLRGKLDCCIAMDCPEQIVVLNIGRLLRLQGTRVPKLKVNDPHSGCVF